MPLGSRRYAPSAARNRDPILQAMRGHLPPSGLLLEIASGTGEHAVHFARALGPGITVQPSDPDAVSRASIDAWVRHAELSNLRAAVALDAASTEWPIAHANAVICINMIHISPWAATCGLMAGAGRILCRDGVLILYGPYRRDGAHTAPSNAEFDADLRARNPHWGVRDLVAVAELAASHGFDAPLIEDMPANNLTLIFKSAR